jgi:hypothetical protein
METASSASATSSIATAGSGNAFFPAIDTGPTTLREETASQPGPGSLLTRADPTPSWLEELPHASGSPPSQGFAFPVIETETVTLRSDRPSRPATTQPKPSTSEPPAHVRTNEPPPIAELAALLSQPEPVPGTGLDAHATGGSAGALTSALEPLAIRPEVSDSLSDRGLALRRDDVAMPRTALVLWSFFALLALILSFAGGVLAGHFLWVGRPMVH